MPESRPGGSLPLVRRIPPWQTALLFLIATGCAAANLYAHPSFAVRAVTILAGVLAVGAAVAALRMYLVVDEAGIGVRRILSETSIDWPDVSDVEVVRGAYNRITMRIVRSDRTFVTIPSSLVLPSKPTSTRRVAAMLGDLAREILALGAPYRGR